MKKLAIKIGFIIFISFLLSLGIDAAYRHIYHLSYDLPHNIFILPEIKDKYDIVALGNSHTEDGIVFDRYGIKSLSLASVGQSLDYDLAYLKMHTRQIKPGAVILITASPESFSQTPAGVGDSLQTNYYDGRISPFLIPNINVGDYLQSRIVPFLRAGYRWRQSIREDIQKRISAEEKWPEAPVATASAQTFVGTTGSANPQANQGKILNVTGDGYWYNVEAIHDELDSPTPVPKDKLVESMNFIFHKWYESGAFSQNSFATNRKNLENIIDYSLNMHWRPVLITIPVSQVLLTGLMSDYMQMYVYNNIAKSHLKGAEYFNFMTDSQITRDNYLFSDSDHLNYIGARIFSYLLLRRLIDHGYLPKTADRYDYNPLWKTQD